MPKSVQRPITDPPVEPGSPLPARFDPLQFFTDAEVAALIGVKPRLVRHWRDTGVIGFTRLPSGRGTRISGADLNDWLARASHPTGEAH